MNNEINFEEFIKNIDCTIYEKIDVDNWNISIEVVLDVVEFLQRSLEDMRTYIVNHPFSNKKEEIYFFKHIKPEVLSRLLYFTEIYNTEMRKPHGSIEVLKKYYNDRLDELTSYFESNLDFYQYYRSKATHLDSHYFVRGHIDFKLCPNCVPYDRDPEFSTCYDHKAAQILANDMLCIYLNKKLHGVDKQVIIAKSRSFLPEHPFRWTATKIAAVELGYAIYAAGILNNGQADIKEIMTFMEASFQIDLGDYYRTYITMKDRKKDRTSFLNSLIKSLLKKMDEDDNL
ncbi:RteC domain-containing protein [Bacteroides fragilis]|uniref:RteC domain-containing protein n=1 Tax=Bacteroides fragilis TaxID=817 RepID=UPI0022AB0E0E|nr:RteC domain-containing protein [Bacteroides fragilis]MCZ2674239.1 RteC domain-containing protein [Bacteroides fragilis]